MVFHHLVGKSWSESAKIRTIALSGLVKVLKDDGKIVFADNHNEGFLFDSSSSRMIFALTSCRIPFLQKLFKAMGAMSAGSGVCMMSQKMWHDLLDNSGLKLVTELETEPTHFMFLKKIILTTKAYKENCMMIAEKNNLQ